MAGFGLIGKGGGAIANVDQNLQIWGLYHLTGLTVSVAILGLDLGDHVVATDGSVTVSLVDTPTQTASWSAAELIAADDDDAVESSTPISVKNGGAAVQVTVPIVIGLPYVSQGQRLRAATADDTKTPTGPPLGLTRRAHKFAVLLQNAVALRFGTSLTPAGAGNMILTSFTDAARTPLADGVAYSGVYEDSLVDDYSFDSMFCWQIERPYPATICAATSFIETDER
jgi:hypothetical protein